MGRAGAASLRIGIGNGAGLRHTRALMPKPIVASYCTTFLKPEMLHIYRQVSGLRRYGTFMVAKERTTRTDFRSATSKGPRETEEEFHSAILAQARPQAAADVLPRRVPGNGADFRRRHADLMHVYFGHTGVHLLPFIQGWEKPCIVSFHGADVMPREHQPNMTKASFANFCGSHRSCWPVRFRCATGSSRSVARTRKSG